MTNLERLIQELCPNGVPLKKVKDVYIRLKGTPITAGKMKEIACEDGEIRVFAGGKTVVDAHEKDIPKANITRIPAVLVQSRGVIDVVYYDKPFTFKNEMWAYTADDSVRVKYLYHVLKNSIKSFRDVAMGMGSLPQISLPVTEEFMLPVPPLEVQREIVRVLDSFMLLTTELKAELIARKKQYEYYRNHLLKYDTSTEIKMLGEICSISAGGDAPKDAISKEKTSEYDIPIISNGVGDNAFYGYTNTAKITSPAVTIAARGTIGYTEYRNYPYFPIVRLLSVIPKDTSVVDTKYLYYCLQGKKYSVPVGGIPQLTGPELQKTKIPVPPIEIQKRLVDVLDNFDTICSDLNIGLPAEIEARQKQYEYYRDLLLTFAEADRMIGGGGNENLIKLIQFVFGYVTLPMGALFDFRNGLSKGKDFFGTGIPFVRYTDVYNNRFLRENDITALVECTPAEVEKLRVRRGDVFFTRTSETAEDVGWSSVMLDDIEDCVFNGFTIKATPKTNYLLPEYCAFCFATDNFRQYVTSHCTFTTRASLTGKTIAEYQLAFPSIEKQQEIVNVLSKFHTLCNDLSAGLPAEIEARQKQYEYYRDKLLSFKELQK